jgi:dienelactone hydrolase
MNLLLFTLLLAQDFKPLPPPGIAIPDYQRKDLNARVRDLDALLAPFAQHPLMPDILVLRNAVRTALDHNEFFKTDEPEKAHRILDEAFLRARQLAAGQTPWTTATGLVIRGYVSELDGSIQPYGLYIPPTWRGPGRLDLWLHGRNETLSEVNFLTERLTRPGEFTPPDAIVLHLYGRYNNATKFAGEVDVLEALAHVKSHYLIDDDRVLVRGFSMGGASAWHLAAHYPSLFAGAAPGAGFAETREYQNLAAKGDIRPAWEQKLWRWYDATEYAANFFHVPLVAYSGEKDRQIQAAQIMERYLKAEGMTLTHIIGPNTEHRYHPDSKPEIERRMSAIARRGRNPYPAELRFTTYTLRYNHIHWVKLTGLEQHWERARLQGRQSADGITLTTSNISALTIDFGPGGWAHAVDRPIPVAIDGQRAGDLTPATDRSATGHFHKANGRWQAGPLPVKGLHKSPGLQGPIDDGFLSSFLMVLPSRAGFSEASDTWVKAESVKAIARWRSLFRGQPRVKQDTEVSPDDIRRHNLILWGDPASNQVLARLAAQLPLEWNAAQLRLANQRCTNCVPALIYPNPLNPARYVVLNSGPTFREDSNLTNSQQTPRLPDWALIGLDEAPGPIRPGRIAAAGFFNEAWQPN